jgi:predicted transcriptional regulator of viral defense system
MNTLEGFLEDRLVNGRAYFSREEAGVSLGLKPETLGARLTRLVKRHRLASPRHGFFLILRPEDQIAGAPDPLCWIDPLMRHHGFDYRISLLRAAAYHGSSHQAAMVFQVIVPRQLRDLEIGYHRVQFLYQAPSSFMQANRPENLERWKNPAGFAQVAGVELTLLDCVRYFHKSAGFNGVAQVVKDIGCHADPRKLARVAGAFENATARRLGLLLDRTGHERQAKALESFVKTAKTFVPFNPAQKPLLESLGLLYERDLRWKLVVNEPVEVDF